MDTSKYTLKNWRGLLEKDWQYLKQDEGTGNIENIIFKLFDEINKQLDVIKNLK